MSKCWYIMFGCLTVMLAAGSVHASTAEEYFEMGNRHYQAAEFDRAVAMYDSVVAQGVESGPLYYNLGNAHYKNGDLGRAILYYMKARRLDPGNQDIVNNLEFAKQFTSVQMEGVQLNPVSSMLESLLGGFRLTTLAWIASGCFVLFVFLLILRFGLGLSGTTIKTVGIASLILVVLALSATTYKYRHDYLTRRGVLLNDATLVRSGPSLEMDVKFQGASGWVVEILSESGEYYNVLFENKRRGWVVKSDLAMI